MTRALLLAALALACVASPAFAMAYPPGQEGAAVGLTRGLLFLSGIALIVALVLAAARRFGVVGIIGAALAALMLSTGGGFAAEASPAGSTVVPLPYGDWIVGLARFATEILTPIIIAALGLAARKLPWYASMWFTTQRIDRMVQLAAEYALSAVESAVAGKALPVDVGYTVLKVALERAIGSSPRWLIDAAGGEKGITERLFRAFRFDESVTDANTLTPLLRDLGVASAGQPHARV